MSPSGCGRRRSSVPPPWPRSRCSEAPSTVALSPAARSKGLRLEVFDRLGSTNDEAGERVRTGDPGGLWIMAREQGAGRGRHGRVWQSPPGNLYASLLLVNPCAPAIAPQIGFVAGVAVHDAVSRVGAFSPGRLTLKWPNDILLDGAKLTGILVEGAVYPGGPAAVIVGCGLNLRHYPPDTPYPATSLADQGVDVSPDAAIAVLADAMDAALETWQGGAGFPRDPAALARAGEGHRRTCHGASSRWRAQRHLRRHRRRRRPSSRRGGTPQSN
jgi:BirA family biotin operon repressor/biotin-[acetyl-CoA-carboxylase] ligase